MIREKYFIPLYMRNHLVALIVCLGVFSHSQSMAQANRHFPFNTVGDAYGKIRNKDVKDRDADAFDEVANIEDIIARHSQCE